MPAAATLLPPAARPQTEPAKSTTVLRDGTQLTGYASLATVTKVPRTVIVSARGGEQVSAPDEVSSCQIGSHRFIVGGGFTVPKGEQGSGGVQDFSEAVDTTDPVQLLAYAYPRPLQTGAAIRTPGVGGMPGPMVGGEALAPPFKV